MRAYFVTLEQESPTTVRTAYGSSLQRCVSEWCYKDQRDTIPEISSTSCIIHCVYIPWTSCKTLVCSAGYDDNNYNWENELLYSIRNLALKCRHIPRIQRVFKVSIRDHSRNPVDSTENSTGSLGDSVVIYETVVFQPHLSLALKRK